MKNGREKTVGPITQEALELITLSTRKCKSAYYRSQPYLKGGPIQYTC